MTDRPEIIRTDAVVLHGMEYGETSRILKLLTRERGLMSTIAKGARSPSIRFGTTLEPMACIEAVIHSKPGRSLQILTETSHLRMFPELRASLERIRIGLGIVELTRAVAQEEQQNDPLFSLVVSTLTALDGTEHRAENIWPFFQLRAARVLGIGPSFDAEVVRSLGEEPIAFDLESGRIAPVSGETSAGPDAERFPAGGSVHDQRIRYGSGARIRVSRAAARAFAVFARADLGDVLRMRLEAGTRLEVESMVSSWMKAQIDDAYPSRSARVFAQFEQASRAASS